MASFCVANGQQSGFPPSRERPALPVDWVRFAKMPAGIFEIKNQNAKIKIEESAKPTT